MGIRREKPWDLEGDFLYRIVMKSKKQHATKKQCEKAHFPLPFAVE
jgi:hypothetical protein